MIARFRSRGLEFQISVGDRFGWDGTGDRVVHILRVRGKLEASNAAPRSDGTMQVAARQGKSDKLDRKREIGNLIRKSRRESATR